MSTQAETIDTGWIGCIDFGTSLSKMAVVRAVPKQLLKAGDVAILAIAERPGIPVGDARLLPSSVFIFDDRIVFGSEAERAGIVNTNQLTFTSLKQYLSIHDLSELDAPLPDSIDPTGQYTARIALTLFLAHLLNQARAVSNAADVPWPIPLRIARPAWDRARAGESEAVLKQIVSQGLAVANILGPSLSAQGGVSHKKAFAALKRAEKVQAKEEVILKLDETGSASVLEATAVAASSIKSTGRRVVVVCDIGGGTSDFGAFITGLRGQPVLAEVADSSQILRKAGDHLDMLLRSFALEKLHYLEGDAAALGVKRDLQRRQRAYKEQLFIDGVVDIRVADDSLRVNLEEFLKSEGVKAFTSQLKETFLITLDTAVTCARNHSAPSKRITVEILFTGGGHSLPMVQGLAGDISWSWNFRVSQPDCENWPSLDQDAPIRQFMVATGGAMLELPRVTAPLVP